MIKILISMIPWFVVGVYLGYLTALIMRMQRQINKPNVGWTAKYTGKVVNDDWLRNMRKEHPEVKEYFENIKEEKEHDKNTAKPGPVPNTTNDITKGNTNRNYTPIN